ncbi:MAG: Rpn family recombination-promoting nuclease/putative transposase [Gammaproteobacteria bacterium]|nr:Rpn family recombination-promoting nuclease/putative transposase [Gammaproteobacteria bacterium]
MDQDAAWKRLFGLPTVVRELLQGYFPDVARILKLGALRELSASWVGADAEQRHGDSAWRVPYADGSGRSMVVLLEFQSTVDRGMAPRILRYQAMAFEALLRQEELDADGQLRLLSVVVYSGTARWTAPGAASGVKISRDGEVLCLRPYVLLDTGQAAQDDFPTDNIVVAAFRLDNAASVGDALALARSLTQGQSTRLDPDTARALMEWLTIMLSRSEDDETRAAVAALRDELLNREAGMTRLAERMKEWDAELLRRGTEQGIEEGIERGIESQRGMLRRQAERKFGPATAAELGRLIADISSTEDLQSISDAIIDCESGHALIAAVGA